MGYTGFLCNVSSHSATLKPHACSRPASFAGLDAGSLWLWQKQMQIKRVECSPCLEELLDLVIQLGVEARRLASQQWLVVAAFHGAPSFSWKSQWIEALLGALPYRELMFKGPAWWPGLLAGVENEFPCRKAWVWSYDRSLIVLLIYPRNPCC